MTDRDDLNRGGATIGDDTPPPPSGKITTPAGPEFVKNNGSSGARPDDHTHLWGYQSGASRCGNGLVRNLGASHQRGRPPGAGSGGAGSPAGRYRRECGNLRPIPRPGRVRWRRSARSSGLGTRLRWHRSVFGGGVCLEVRCGVAGLARPPPGSPGEPVRQVTGHAAALVSCRHRVERPDKLRMSAIIKMKLLMLYAFIMR